MIRTLPSGDEFQADVFGIIAGIVLVAAVMFAMYDGALSARQVSMVVAYAALMLGVCLLACIVPTRRALRVEPTCCVAGGRVAPNVRGYSEMIVRPAG